MQSAWKIYYEISTAQIESQRIQQQDLEARVPAFYRRSRRTYGIAFDLSLSCECRQWLALLARNSYRSFSTDLCCMYIPSDADSAVQC